MFPVQTDGLVSDDDLPEEFAEEEEVTEEPDELTVYINEEISECFALFDKNQSETLEIKYLEKALKCLGIFISPLELEELKEDVEDEGTVSFQCFQKYAFAKMMEIDLQDSLKVAFEALDPEGEGTIPAHRLKKWMTTLGDPLTEKEAKELIKLGDPANKGVVAYNDIVRILLLALTDNDAR